MKKTLLFIITIIFFGNNISFAQICDDAYEINSLPFIKTNINTANADCDITGNYCNSSGQSGNDTIFKFYSNNNQNIDLILSNVIIQYDWLVNIFLLDTCPDVATSANCINSVSGGVFTIINQHLDSNKTYYFVISNTSLAGINHFIFDLEVRNHYSYDLAIVEYNEPRSYYDLMSANGEISAWIKNNGDNTIDTIKFGVLLNGVYYDSIYTSANLLPLETRKFYPFYNDLSADGEYITKLFLFNEDMDNSNDTLKKSSHNLYEINTFPDFTNFESGNNGWVTEWSKKSNIEGSWELGIPNGNIIDTAASGVNAFVTNLNGGCTVNEVSYLVSQSFDFSNISIPMIEFDLWKSLDSTASVFIEYTDSNENIWHKIGTVGSGTNWYNSYLGQNDNTWLGNSNGWIRAKNRIDGAGGKPHVHLRFVFSNLSHTTPEGVAIDNIRIYEAPNHDIGVTSIISPVSKCNINNDSITVVISNFSPDSAHSNFVVKTLIDNTYELIDTVTQTVQANDSLIYTFNNTYNFNEYKKYKIKASTYLINEDDTTNDSDSTVFYNFNNNSLPYFNNFETNNGTWFSTGINPSWEYGTPTDSVISSAASGNMIWATNLSGYHNKPEESYLTSSCFDLSQIENPIIKFNANYDLYIDNGVTSSYVQMQYSNDNGANWASLGTANENWYDAGFSWVGKSENWVQKLYNISDLTNLGEVQFRYKLFALEEKTGFAFDDFTICNAPVAGFTYSASGRDVFINDTSNYGTSYEWYINDTLVSSEQNPILTVLKDTTHITQVVINDCFSDTITHSIFTSSIYELSNGNIKIYPNPTNNNFYIENNKYNISSIEIINSLGKTELLTLTRDKQKNYKIDISNLYNGIYIIKIKTNSAIFIGKIIKK